MFKYYISMFMHMKESNTLAGNATIKQVQRAILVSIKGQCMKESNILAGNATIKQAQKAPLLNMKGQYIKESNTLAMQLSSKYKEKSARTSESSP